MAAPEDPSYISYLLSPDLCDWFFVVGNADLVKPERIGVVKKMLLAHSVALRSDMIDYKKDYPVNDTYPDTFKNLLRFVYGYDNTGSLSFEEADNLLYMAETYLVEPLKARLSARLMELLDSDNLCILLNNPACSRDLNLNFAITRILQYETDRVFASRQFLDLSLDALVKVVQQKCMNVPEIEVWRAAVLWAKHQVHSDSVERQRRALEEPAKHIRLCTIDYDDLCQEVFPTGILTGDEVAKVCRAKRSGEEQRDLVSFSKEIKSRIQLPEKEIKFDRIEFEELRNICIFRIKTKLQPVELLSLRCRPVYCSRNPKNRVLNAFEGIFLVFQVYLGNIPPVIMKFYKHVNSHDLITVPFTVAGRNIILQPKRDYTFVMALNNDLTMFGSEKRAVYETEHFDFYAGDTTYGFFFPATSLQYRPLPVEE